MNLNGILPAITGAGGALVVLATGMWWFVTGKIVTGKSHAEIIGDKDQQITFWQAAYAAERTRADSAVAALQTTNNVLTALHREVSS